MNPSEEIREDGGHLRLALRRYFLNGVVWGVLAVPVVYGLGIFGVAALSWVVGDEWKEEKTENTAMVIGGILALTLALLMFFFAFLPGWRIMRRAGKGALAALAVALAGLVVYGVMSAIYLAAALGLTWLLLYKI